MSDRPVILLADDEPSLIEELEDFLGWNGMTVLTARDGREALDVLAAHPDITAVLTDIRMPHVTGLTLASQIMGARGEADAVEVVLMTGHGSVESATEAVRSGAFDFLRKPMVLADVLSVVRRAHAKAAKRREAEAARVAELARVKSDFAALQSRLAHAGAPFDPANAAPPDVARLLSHELHTPLNLLSALPDLVTGGGEIQPEILQALMPDVEMATGRLKEIAGDLIDLLAPQAPRPSSFRPAASAALVARVAARFADDAARQKVRLTSAGEPGSVVTDEPLLQAALSRLVANAVTACASTGGSVEVAAEALPDGRVAFRVRDTGPGMTEAELATARLPFQQLDMSLARRNGGLGLGLTLADRAAVRLGGRLDIDSVPGQGTSAAIVIPRSPAETAGG